MSKYLKTMKLVIFSWMVTLLNLITTIGYAQEDVFNKIEQCIRAGDAVTLSAFFSNNVEITIGKADQDYAKAQAQFVM